MIPRLSSVSLHYPQRPQVLARFVETAAAEGDDRVSPGSGYLVRRCVQILPPQFGVVEMEVGRILILKDGLNLFKFESLCVAQRTGDEDIQETVCLRSKRAVVVSERMMESRCEFD